MMRVYNTQTGQIKHQHELYCCSSISSIRFHTVGLCSTRLRTGPFLVYNACLLLSITYTPHLAYTHAHTPPTPYFFRSRATRLLRCRLQTPKLRPKKIITISKLQITVGMKYPMVSTISTPT